jgi:hypothetical protein
VDRTTVSRNNPMIPGVICVSVTPPTSQLKKLTEHSQLLERCGRLGRDLDVEGSGSITSSGNTYIKAEFSRRGYSIVVVL